MRARILVAAAEESAGAIKGIIGESHDIFATSTLAQALDKLKKEKFDLIMVGVHFDESRMFELLRASATIPENSETPIICFCTRETALTRSMHETIKATAKVLGAWMYIDQYEYRDGQDPAADMRSLIERCLTGEARRKTQEERVESLKQREELQRLREALEGSEWSENLEDRVLQLRTKLAEAVLELCELREANVSQQQEIDTSDERKDVVPEAAQLAENVATRLERQMLLDETKQKAREVEIGEREETKRTEGRRNAGDSIETLAS